jgi:hypothetical protein
LIASFDAAAIFRPELRYRKRRLCPRAEIAAFASPFRHIPAASVSIEMSPVSCLLGGTAAVLARSGATPENPEPDASSELSSPAADTRAQRLGIRGWCHNHPDASVEGAAAGPSDAIAKL